MAEQPSLDGPLARIDRADEIIVDLAGALQASLSGRPYSVEERPDENPRARDFVVTSLREIPLRPRLIAGEIADDLRASLDLLAYQLLLKAGIDDEDRLTTCAFPVITNRPVEAFRQEEAR